MTLMTMGAAHPLIPGMRLDELLAELQARLEAVLATRDRVHSLLEAVVLVGSDLELAEARQDAERLGLLEDRDRIARTCTTWSSSACSRPP